MSLGNRNFTIGRGIAFLLAGLSFLNLRSGSAAGQCPIFTFEKIAETGDTPPMGQLDAWQGFANGPAVGATHAAFQAFQEDEVRGLNGLQAIYIHNGMSNSLVADFLSPVPELGSYHYDGFDPDMTIEGTTVGFEGFIIPDPCVSCEQRGFEGEIVVTADGGAFTNRADTVQDFGDFFIFESVDEPSLRDGNVFFRGTEVFDFRGQPVGDGVFTDQGGSIHDLINMGDPVPGLPDYVFSYDPFDPDVSSDGTNTTVIAHIEQRILAETPSTGQVVLKVDLSGNATNVANSINTIMPDSGGALFQSFHGPAIQNGNIAFWGTNYNFNASPEPLREGIYTTLGGTLRRVADTTTQVPGRSVNFSAIDADSIAIYGNRIAFIGSFPIEGALDPMGMGIYVEDNGTLCKIIDTDDLLDGRIPISFKLQRNEALFGDRLGFRVTFAPPTTQPVVGGIGPTGPQAIYVTLIQSTSPGACCLSDNTCMQLTQMDCTAYWGTYYGDGTSCNLVECNPSRRAGYHTKGDLLVWPYVKIRWDDNFTPDPFDDIALTDTFISATNDDTANHRMKFYFIEGRLWNNTNRTLNFTGNQPRYWSALTGMGGSTSGMSFRALNPLGLPDGPNQNIRKLEGFIIGFTVDDNNVPVKTNQMAGSATVVDRQMEAAWEYKPWAFRSICQPVSHDGDPVGLLDGAGFKLALNGQFYQRCPSHLLIDFWAAGTNAFGPTVLPPIVPSVQDFEITLMTMYIDLRAVPDHDMNGIPGEPPVPGGSANDSSPPTTAVEVLSWNENEIAVSNTIRCLTCWDTKLASMYGIGGASSPFTQTTLQTIKGKARLRGKRDSRCDQSANSPNSQVLVYEKYSKDLPILGVVHKIITWGPDRIAKANSALTAAGDRTDGCILLDHDNVGPPPTVASPAAGASVNEDSETLTPPRNGIGR